jgi:acyl dehydratase
LTIVIRGREELLASVGREASSDWQPITQHAVDEFARLSGDRNPMHVEPEHAARGPHGGTIAHGGFTLALIPMLMARLWRLEGFAATVDAGLSDVRFLAPLPVGGDVRMRLRIEAVRPLPGGAECTTTLRFERRGERSPACVARALTRVAGS